MAQAARGLDWAPSHRSLDNALPRVKASGGAVQAIDRRANRFVNAAAKAAAEEPPPPDIGPWLHAALWGECHEQLADDFILKATRKAIGVRAALHAIDLLLHSHGQTTDDFDLPRSEACDDDEFRNRQLRHALGFDSVAEAEAAAELASQLNAGH